MSTPLRANFIGCGKLGKTFGYLFAKNKSIAIQNIMTKSKETSQNAIEFIGQLLQKHQATPHSIFVHFSGVLTSDELNSAGNLGYATASVHPIKSFGSPKDNIQNIKGTMCSYEGAAEFFDLFSKMITGIG